MTWEIALWFCCLNPRERAILRATAIGLAETLYVGIPRPLWELLWLGTPQSGDAVREAFISIYGLEIGSIVVDGADIEVVTPRDGWFDDWLLWGVYILTPGAACLEGCGQVSFP